MELFQPWHVIILLVISGLFAVVYFIPLWLIAEKAGLQKWIAAFAIIPFGGLVVLYYIAFTKWNPKSA